MKVLFDHANPFLLAHGGFQIQIEQTKIALEKIGVQVDWLRWWDPAQKGDLIHYFGRPHPAYIRHGQQKGMPVVMEELLTGLGSRGKLARGIQKIFMIAAKRILPREFIARLCWDSYRLANAVIANTEWERRLMISMFKSLPQKTHLLPNGVEEEFFIEPGSTTPKKPFLICSGTITQRKNMLELCMAAQRARVPLEIYGAPYYQTDPYFQAFSRELAKPGSFIRYHGACHDRRVLAEAYKKAAGFVLLSSMETRSLSAEEAAAAGCALLLADLPWARSVYEAGATYCPLGSFAETVERLRLFYINLSSAPRPARPKTWHEVAIQLKNIYLRAIRDR